MSQYRSSMFFGVWLSAMRLFYFMRYCDIMDKNKTAVFIGHRNCQIPVDKVIPFIEKEILSGIDTFLSGGQGAFDEICADAVYQLKKKYPKIKNILVVPYHNFRIFDETLFDDIINSDTSNSISYTGFTTAIPKRNRYMIKNASTAICYVRYISGGAYVTLDLAKKNNLKIINIVDL